MKKQELAQSKLQNELRYFGLNPSEWTLQRMHALSYLVQNKLDKNFALQGRLEFRRQKPQWKSLELISL